MTATRGCATCGAWFPVPANNPHRRYCSPRCRVADWHRRHDRPIAAVAGDPPPAGAQAGNAAAHGVPGPDGVPNAAPPPNGASATARCPHCGHPVTVINLLVPPAAAHVATPGARHG